jgi:hypothetical protein
MEDYGQFVIIDIHVTKIPPYRPPYVQTQPEIIPEIPEPKENETVPIDITDLSVDHLWLTMLCTFLDCI